MALEQEGRKEDGGHEHKAPSASGSCLAVNGREHSHSKHGPARGAGDGWHVLCKGQEGSGGLERQRVSRNLHGDEMAH